MPSKQTPLPPRLAHQPLLLSHSPTSALQDLQEAHDIAQRSGMRLFLTDYHLESARLALTLDQTVHEQTAKQHLTQARDLIKATGYKRRLPELEYLENLPGQTR